MNRDVLRYLALEIYAFFLVKYGIIKKSDVLNKEDQELLELAKKVFGDKIIGGELEVLRKLALNYEQYEKDNLISIIDRIAGKFERKKGDSLKELLTKDYKEREKEVKDEVSIREYDKS